MIFEYDKKVIISGDIVEIYEYEKSIVEGFENTYERGRCFEASEEDKELNREKVCNRAKRDVKRLINTNISHDSKFVTLTFRDNVTDIKFANYEFKKFRQRFERYIKRKLQYVAVIEFQKRGAIHYHVVLFNVPYIPHDTLKDIWGNGFVKINRIEQCDNVGAYVSKYMTKNDDDRLRGEKMYFSSRSLEHPCEIKEKEQVEHLANALPADTLTYECKFSNKHNKVIYKQYNIKKLKNEECSVVNS